MTEGVGADGLLYTGQGRILLDVDKEADTAQMLAAGGGHKHIVLLPRLHLDVLPHHEPFPQAVDGLRANGHQPFLAALPHHPDETLLQMQARDEQPAQFADAQATTIENLQDGQVAHALGLAQVYSRLDALYLLQRKHRGQMFPYLRTLQQFRRVGVYLFFQQQKPVERPHAAEHPCRASGCDAAVAELARKEVQLLQCHTSEVDALVCIEVDELLQVLHVCIQGVLGVGTLHLEVHNIASDDVFIHNSAVGYLIFHKLLLSLQSQSYKIIMRIQIINGPNLNLLGIREPGIYGKRAWEDYLKDLRTRYPHVRIDYYQSNLEGEIINKIQEVGFDRDGIVLNAGAYTHTSVAILDAIKSVNTPTVEVHISNVHQREEFRHHSMISLGCMGVICGFGLDSYRLAIEAILTKSEADE